MPAPETSNYPGLSLTLPTLEQKSWQQLVTVLDNSSGETTAPGFKTMTVASRTATGADARTVVLRKVDADRKYVWFHTDVRAAKVMQFEAFPDCTLLFWDEKSQVQLRLTVETRLHTDDYVADEHWQTIGAGNRKNYLSEYRPGSEQPAPYPGFPAHLGAGLPSAEESEAGRANFAVIECRVLAMDYLQLNRSGQVRALFQYEPESKMVWLAP
ncbi:PNPOx family protein [Spirosoma radiotolerans]|uniref:Pyridoxamine 5'-phosphate oxidase n=1 Tax=Spirosoma radiotolerans TaxID=1379870 RepID=A0A0E3V7X1_9BACT|nr:pyridoxamine 5'-phosphate oxidase family protein [Spirosoma radiotolerans]AKD55806.1 pyridoxamine 5'-phosphate oxidase [Spirosoma radiotolerans]